MKFFNKEEMLKRIYNNDEKILFSNILDKITFCLIKNEPFFSDFVDPVKVSNFISIIESSKIKNLKTKAFGGLEDSERKMIGFSKDEYVEDENFPITTLEISYNEKYSRALSHRDFLGSILGLGITRDTVGDIVLIENKAYVFLFSEIALYVSANLEKVGNTKVKIGINKLDKSTLPTNKKENIKITVSSLRLDAVVSACFKISRGKSADLIQNEKVFINWKPAKNSSKQVFEKDIITLRGFGRVELYEVVGKTKKDKIILNVLKS